MEKIRKIARELQHKYYDYYCTVYFDFIVEAVENTIDDFGRVCNLEEMHQHIIENYI